MVEIIQIIEGSMPKGIPKQAPGGNRDDEYPEDGVLRETVPKRQRAVAKTKNGYRGRKKDYDPDQFDLEYDHPDLYKGGYSPEKKVQAIVAYMISGTFAQAERMCGVPQATISTWKRESAWWPALTSQISKHRNDELDIEFTNILHKTTDSVMDRLENGDEFYDAKSGELYKKQVTSTNLAKILSVTYSNRALLRGDPTSRVEKISTEERLSRLSNEFKKFSTAKDVTAQTVITKEEDTENDK